MNSHRMMGRGRNDGAVLLMVLWIVAALSIAAGGLTRSVREEARIISRERQRIMTLSLGDAAIQLVLRDLVAKPKPIEGLLEIPITYRGVPIVVEVMPSNGLIDLNHAPVALLQRLFATLGGMPSDQAQQLAETTNQYRTTKVGKGELQRFDAPEDLLKVPGMDFGLYAKIQMAITTDTQSSGKVNPLAAPLGVLQVLAGGDAALAGRIYSARTDSGASTDTTALASEFIERAQSTRLIVTAVVPGADRAMWRLTRQVDIGIRSRDGGPWHVFRSEPAYTQVSR